jgi:hypothetical protein
MEHHVQVPHQDAAPNGGSRYTRTTNGAPPQVDGDIDRVRRLKLHQEHVRGWAAPTGHLLDHRQHQAIPRPSRWWGNPQPDQSGSFLEVADLQPRRRGCQPPLQHHHGKAGAVPVHGHHPLWVPGPEDVSPIGIIKIRRDRTVGVFTLKKL